VSTILFVPSLSSKQVNYNNSSKKPIKNHRRRLMSVHCKNVGRRSSLRRDWKPPSNFANIVHTCRLLWFISVCNKVIPILSNDLIFGVMRVCTFFIVGQTAGPIQRKLDIWTQLEPGSLLVKSRSRSSSRSAKTTVGW